MQKVLIVFAHPERRSLNGHILDTLVQQLQDQGAEVKVSDLYALNWKSQVDQDDFPLLARDKPFNPQSASQEYAVKQQLTQDVLEEQKKVLWCDTLLYVFPLWWFYTPAILKGWIDRVLADGFAYNYDMHYDVSDIDTLKKKTITGRTASFVVTMGGSEDRYKPGDATEMIDGFLSSLHVSFMYCGMNGVKPLYFFNTKDPEHMKNVDLPGTIKSFVKRLSESPPTPAGADEI